MFHLFRLWICAPPNGGSAVDPMSLLQPNLMGLRSAGHVSIGVMDDCLSLQCPYCGESAELRIDVDGGARQTYVEDCPICCRPWRVDAWVEEDSWRATLRTEDA